MASSGKTAAHTKALPAKVVAFASETVQGVTFTLHGRPLRTPDDTSLFALPLPAPFGAHLLQSPVYWSWSSSEALTDAYLSQMLAHLVSTEKVHVNPIVIRDMLSTVPSATDHTVVEDDDNVSDVSLSQSEDEGEEEEPCTDISDAEEDVINLIDGPLGLDDS